MTGINRLNRITRFSSLKSNRIRQSYVDRLSNSQLVTRVEPIDPTNPTDNPTGHSSHNHLLSYENYYNNVNGLKQEFKSFYHDPGQLNDALTQLNIKPTKLMEKTNRLIGRYNQTVTALTDLDSEKATATLSKLKLIIEKYSPRLESIGIHEVKEDCLLVIDEGEFLDRVSKNPDPYRNLFLPIKKIVTDLYIALLSIKSQSKLVSKYHQFPDGRLGKIIDKKT